MRPPRIVAGYASREIARHSALAFRAEATRTSPAIALWLPNATFGAVAISLRNRARRGEG